MGDIVAKKKVGKTILIVTNAGRMRSQMKDIRALGYECTVTENVGAAMAFLRDGERANVVVVDLVSERSAEKLIRWIKENRPGVRTVCVHAVADLSEIPRIIRDILEPASPPEIMR